VLGNLGVYPKEKKGQYVDGPNCPFGIMNHVQIHLSKTVMQVNGKDYEIASD
jgi:hypothetical protein